MSEESTAAIAELAQLERDLKAGAQPKPVQLVNNPAPVQADRLDWNWHNARSERHG